jgi:hypothetical protein
MDGGGFFPHAEHINPAGHPDYEYLREFEAKTETDRNVV